MTNTITVTRTLAFEPATTLGDTTVTYIYTYGKACECCGCSGCGCSE